MRDSMHGRELHGRNGPVLTQSASGARAIAGGDGTCVSDLLVRNQQVRDSSPLISTIRNGSKGLIAAVLGSWPVFRAGWLTLRSTASSWAAAASPERNRRASTSPRGRGHRGPSEDAVVSFVSHAAGYGATGRRGPVQGGLLPLSELDVVEGAVDAEGVDEDAARYPGQIRRGHLREVRAVHPHAHPVA